MYFRIVISYTVMLDVGCATAFAVLKLASLQEPPQSPLVQIGAALKISGSLKLAVCGQQSAVCSWQPAPRLWGWPLFRYTCNNHFVHNNV